MVELRARDARVESASVPVTIAASGRTTTGVPSVVIEDAATGSSACASNVEADTETSCVEARNSLHLKCPRVYIIMCTCKYNIEY